MNALVVFDSNYGNTQKIAEAIAGELGARAINVSDLGQENLDLVQMMLGESPQ